MRTVVRPGSRRRRVRVLPTLAVALTLSLTLIGAKNAFAISRDTVLARAQTWVDRAVPYSQSHYFGGYRTDCSGYVSMCWQTGRSWTTSTFHDVASKITTTKLLPGDALLRAGHHIRLFYGWVDEARTTYVCYEQTGPVTRSSIKRIADDIAYGYVPYRYRHISSSPVSDNLLRNGSFNVWAIAPGATTATPAWWGFSGSRDTTLTMRRMDMSKTPRNALQLVNVNADSGTYTDMSQTVTITAGTRYAVSVWARTACSPAGLELRIAYLDSSGTAIPGTSTTGAACGVGAATFVQMSKTVTAPLNAVRAVVTVRLAGGTSTTPSGTVPGTSAVVDEISLARPRAVIGAHASSTTTRFGKKVTLSGSVAPTATVGSMVAMWVRRPGGSWVRFAGAKVYAAGSGAAWRGTYYFRRGTRAGSYSFKAAVPAVPGWLGAWTSTVGVRVR